ncbi:hypothetical protein B194_4859 [Serratia plymuthica A30]|nr:hypothetical protein B194_4859 [Serratia plymuthica A30]
MPTQFASLHAFTDLQRHGAQRQSIVSEAVKADLMPLRSPLRITFKG